MANPEESFEEAFPYMSAALKAAESAKPGNELQQAAAADIIRLAFDQEVQRAFPERTDTDPSM